MFAELTFSNLSWMPLAMGALAMALALTIWSYWGSGLAPRVKILCGILKVAGFLLLVLALLEPGIRERRPRPGSNFFAVIVDNSRGLRIQDVGEQESRGDKIRSAIAQEAWMAPLEKTYRLRRYLFDSRLEAVSDFGGLSFEGHRSALGAALGSLRDRYRGQPLAGAVVITDGIATDQPLEALKGAEGLPPIYFVVAGKQDVIPDLAIESIAVTETAFEDTPVTVRLNLRSRGLEDEQVKAAIYRLNGAESEAPVIERIVEVGADGVMEPVEFLFRPENPGLNFYAARVESLSGAEEGTLENNQRLFVVERGGGPYRVLYVAGRPNWEYKFIRRSLSEDEQTYMAALIRIAKREPKFEFKGRQGESSNPLFRGFDRKDEDTERYDEPVLVRLDIRDESELKGGFPKAAEDLFQYHGVILDDLEAAFFTHDQMILIERFVSERGGGLLMLGGQESFAEGAYARTPVGSLLPVYLDRAAPDSLADEWRLELTREGWVQPWVRLRETEEAERRRLREAPGFEVVNRVENVKPGAMALATVQDARGAPLPALVAQRFGKGRSGALLVGDLWSWGLRNEEQMADLQKFWRQTIRWLVAESPRRVEIDMDESDEAGGRFSLKSVVRTEQFDRMENARVELEVFRPGEEREGESVFKTVMTPSEDEPGLYAASFAPSEAGGYVGVVAAYDVEGKRAGEHRIGWATDPGAEEFRALTPNLDLMETIARATGGAVMGLDELAAFAERAESAEAPIEEVLLRPVWHRPWYFILALGCFIGEWGIRRWRGLP